MKCKNAKQHFQRFEEIKKEYKTPVHKSGLPLDEKYENWVEAPNEPHLELCKTNNKHSEGGRINEMKVIKRNNIVRESSNVS